MGIRGQLTQKGVLRQIMQNLFFRYIKTYVVKVANIRFPARPKRLHLIIALIMFFAYR